MGLHLEYWLGFQLRSEYWLGTGRAPSGILVRFPAPFGILVGYWPGFIWNIIQVSGFIRNGDPDSGSRFWVCRQNKTASTTLPLSHVGRVLTLMVRPEFVQYPAYFTYLTILVQCDLFAQINQGLCAQLAVLYTYNCLLILIYYRLGQNLLIINKNAVRSRYSLWPKKISKGLAYIIALYTITSLR